MATSKHILSTAVIVLNADNEILLINNPKRGWVMPGGQVEEGESLRAGAIREVKEETGIDVELTKFCGIFQHVKKSICHNIFRGIPIGGNFKTSKESLEVGYYTIEEALKMVTWKNFTQRIEYALKEDMHPFIVEY